MSFSTTSVIFLTKGCWRNAFLFGFISEQQPGRGCEFRYTPEYLHSDSSPVSLIIPKREEPCFPYWGESRNSHAPYLRVRCTREISCQ